MGRSLAPPALLLARAAGRLLSEGALPSAAARCSPLPAWTTGAGEGLVRVATSASAVRGDAGSGSAHRSSLAERLLSSCTTPPLPSVERPLQAASHAALACSSPPPAPAAPAAAAASASAPLLPLRTCSRAPSTAKQQPWAPQSFLVQHTLRSFSNQARRYDPPEGAKQPPRRTPPRPPGLQPQSGSSSQSRLQKQAPQQQQQQQQQQQPDAKRTARAPGAAAPGPSAAAVKELQLGVRIAEHDLATKLRRAEGWLGDGLRVEVAVEVRAADQSDAAASLVDKVASRLAGKATPIGQRRMHRGRWTLTFRPKPPKEATDAKEGGKEQAKGDAKGRAAAKGKAAAAA